VRAHSRYMYLIQ